MGGPPKSPADLQSGHAWWLPADAGIWGIYRTGYQDTADAHGKGGDMISDDRMDVHRLVEGVSGPSSLQKLSRAYFIRVKGNNIGFT